MLYAEIIVPIPTPTYTYLVPKELEEAICIGARVEIPFGKSSLHLGVVARLHGVAPAGSGVKSIRQLIDSKAIFTPLQLDLWQWMSTYYMTPIGEIYRRMTPTSIRKNLEKVASISALELFDPEMRHEPKVDEIRNELHKSKAQLAAFERFISQANMSKTQSEEELRIEKNTFAETNQVSSATIKNLVDRQILRVVTISPYANYSSVKGSLNAPEADSLATQVLHEFTEHQTLLLHHSDPNTPFNASLYLPLIERQMAQGRLTMILAPDNFSAQTIIENLEPALNKHFTNCHLLAYHSRLSEGRRLENYLRMAQHPESVDVVVGVRSALFLPFINDKLGLITVVGEENFAYKQGEHSPRYNGRDMAIVVAKKCAHASVLLTSEAPSLESYTSATTGKWGYLHIAPMDQRPRFMVLERGKGLLSKYLIRRLEQEVNAGNQALIFQNRRGFASHLECRECFYTPQCPHCSVSLTYHKNQGALLCHYCGHTRPYSEQCPACKSHTMRLSGIGTQRIEEDLSQIFPQFSIARLDYDNTRRGGAFAEIAYDFASNRSDILVGTKLMINGLDFSRVGLVGILNADNMLSNSDFRCSEHAFGLMTQLASRVGLRGGGEVVIQTSKEHNSTIVYAKNGDAQGFYTSELEQRRELMYPPFSRMMIIVFSHPETELLLRATKRCDSLLRPIFGTRLSPVFEPSVGRIAGRYILHQMLRIERSRSSVKAKEILSTAIDSLRQEFRQLTIYVDVDPI